MIERAKHYGFLPGLSGKLALLTVAFVLLAEILIFVPSMAGFRNSWLRDKLAAAQTATIALEATPADTISDAMAKRLLDDVGAFQIAVKTGSVRRLVASVDDMPEVEAEIDLRRSNWLADMASSVRTLLHEDNRILRLLGPATGGAEFIELVIDETPLRSAMYGYAKEIALLSLLISTITALLLYASLNRLILRPVKRLAESFSAFGQNTANVIAPSARNDELGEAERELAAMQTALGQQIKQQQHLASLGLAVAKINHDLRNLLASAQLLSDRIASAPDPTVQRLAPKLVSALDRAVSFCESTLAFGKAEERAPSPRKFELGALIADLADILALGPDAGIHFTVDLPGPMIIRADLDQLLRVLLNLCRNAVEALQSLPQDGGERRLTVAARSTESGIEINVIDTGPGIAPALRPRLFQPFAGAGRVGGTGLGLAIAAELMAAQGGSIRLIDSEKGAQFRLILPH